MAYRISGTYVVSCSCSLICPCAVDGTPTGPDNKCYGASVWHVDRGDLDGADLSDVNFALYFHLPSNLTAGNWKVRLVVDERASDDQASALERIIGGQEGGPFAEFAPLIADVATGRARVDFSDGDSPSGKIAGEAEIAFEPLRGPDGSPTTVKGAMFAFAPEYKIGKSTGRSTVSGFEYEPVYGEAAQFEYSSEMTPEQIRPRA
jgi:hypothetical protein